MGVFAEFVFPLGRAQSAEALPVLGAKENEVEAFLVAMEGGVRVEEALEDLVVGRVVDFSVEMKALEPILEGRSERLGGEGGRDFEGVAGAGRGLCSWLEEVLDADIDRIVAVFAGGKVVAPLSNGGEVEGRGEDFDGVTGVGQDFAFGIDDEGLTWEIEVEDRSRLD